MYKHARGLRIDDSAPEGPGPLPFECIAYKLGGTNQGRLRMTRHVTEHADRFHAKRRFSRNSRPCWLYVYVRNTRTGEIIARRGDPAAEKEWDRVNMGEAGAV